MALNSQKQKNQLDEEFSQNRNDNQGYKTDKDFFEIVVFALGGILALLLLIYFKL